MNPMTEDESRAFLSSGSRTGKLGTVRRDGRPHVTPIWFVLDGDDLVFMTHEGSLKGKILRRESRVMLSVDEEVFPYAFVLVEGRATLERPTAEELWPWSRRIAERYVPADMLDATAKRNAVEGELLVRVAMSKITGIRGVAS